MQTLEWYYKRLKVMSAGEIAWRMRSSMRDCFDRFVVGQRQRPRELAVILNGDGHAGDARFRVCDISVGDARRPEQGNGLPKQWLDRLLARAERIAGHRLDFFDLEDKHLGDPIAWNRDHKRGQDTPMVFAPSLDYRDLNEAGDCKFVWEPNRHHQLVVLGRAYRRTGDDRFARAVAEQLESWLDQNPFGLGMNWRSGLELGIRLINWVWALDLIKESGAITYRLRHRILDSVARHIWEIDRKYSRGSSVNNHLIGEAAGVFIAASYFANLKHAPAWRQRSHAILEAEILNQTHADGGTVEQAIGYHLFVLQLFVVAGLVARATGQDFGESYWSRLEKMFEFLGVLSEGGDSLPAFGDGDDGYVLDLGDEPRSIHEWLAVGAALFGRSDFKTWSGGYSEPIEWLLGQAGHRKFDSIGEPDEKRITSRAFADSGYYLLQYGRRGSPDRISVVFDCGPLGMGALAAHGHADALSFTLRAFGTEVLVDPGTYDYFSYPKWREYFRSTRAHNTVVIDGQDQSEMLGPFLWGSKAAAKSLSWEPSDTGGKVSGEHDGYTGLKDPVIHRRTLQLDGPKRELLVRDEIVATGRHDVQISFHLAEQCTVEPAGANRYVVDTGRGTVRMELDRRLEVETYNGSEEPIYGWVSRGYHRKQPSPTLVGRLAINGRTSIVCRLEIGKSQRPCKEAEV